MFRAMVKKEFLLVLRDKHALMALFIMPAIFILIMSVALRDQFKQDEVSFEISLVDRDGSTKSKSLIEKITEDKSFHVVNKSEAVIEIVIPKGYAQSKNSQKVEVTVLDALKGDFLELFKAKLTKEILQNNVTVIKEELSQLPDFEMSDKSFEIETSKLISMRYKDSKQIPSSTQQSVPSWIVFGMFFVIIPMSTIFINERKQNTLTRLSSMNVSLISMTLSKIVPYLLINQVQVWIMLGVGVFIVPFFDTPALSISGDISAIVLLSFALSLSAIGLSTLLAVSASSAEQATTIGGILNILLGAIGGVMVPKFIMPEAMQELSQISPMSWGLDGFLEIFLKSADITMVANEAFMLMLFGVITLIFSMIILQIRIKRGL